MSGGLFANQLLREIGVEISPERIARLADAHAKAYRQYGDGVRPLPGARELLSRLTDNDVDWAIATSGRMATAAMNLAALDVDPDRQVVVTLDQLSTRTKS